MFELDKISCDNIRNIKRLIHNALECIVINMYKGFIDYPIVGDMCETIAEVQINQVKS